MLLSAEAVWKGKGGNRSLLSLWC